MLLSLKMEGTPVRVVGSPITWVQLFHPQSKTALARL